MTDAEKLASLKRLREYANTNAGVTFKQSHVPALDFALAAVEELGILQTSLRSRDLAIKNLRENFASMKEERDRLKAVLGETKGRDDSTELSRLKAAAREVVTKNGFVNHDSPELDDAIDALEGTMP